MRLEAAAIAPVGFILRRVVNGAPSSRVSNRAVRSNTQDDVLHRARRGARSGEGSDPRGGCVLARWVALERRCCPFLRFAVSTDATSVILAISGDARAKRFIRAEFTSDHLIDVSKGSAVRGPVPTPRPSDG